MGISLQKVSYSYYKKKKNTKYALKDIDLSIKQNDEFIALVGHTGSGKSTLSTIFNALKIPTSGDALIFSIKLKERRRRKDKYNTIRGHVGLVFQFPDYQLFEETVIKDVMFGPKNFGHKKDAKDLATHALELVNFPIDKYESSPFTLSGGEKKMVSIAGILASDPDIIVLDEPTAGLDPSSREKVLKLLVELNTIYHKSIVIITHDMNVVYRYTKRVIVMSKGEIVIDTNPKELFINRNDLVEKYHLDYPDTIRLTNYLNNKLGLKLNKYGYTLDELMEEIVNESS